LYVCIIYV